MMTWDGRICLLCCCCYCCYCSLCSRSLDEDSTPTRLNLISQLQTDGVPATVLTVSTVFRVLADASIQRPMVNSEPSSLGVTIVSVVWSASSNLILLPPANFRRFMNSQSTIWKLLSVLFFFFIVTFCNCATVTFSYSFCTVIQTSTFELSAYAVGIAVLPVKFFVHE